MDVARSTLAELEVGLITIADLRDRAEGDLSRDADRGAASWSSPAAPASGRATSRRVLRISPRWMRRTR